MTKCHHVRATEDYLLIRGRAGLGVGLLTMTEATKRTLKRVIDIVIAVLTALITTLSAHAAGIVR